MGLFIFLTIFFSMRKSHDRCQESLNKFLEFCTLAGIPTATEKTFKPSKVMDFVGITLDSTAMQACLPLEKVHKYYSLIQDFLERKSCKKREMESLTGYLNFTCSIYITVAKGCVLLSTNTLTCLVIYTKISNILKTY